MGDEYAGVPKGRGYFGLCVQIADRDGEESRGRQLEVSRTPPAFQLARLIEPDRSGRNRVECYWAKISLVSSGSSLTCPCP